MTIDIEKLEELAEKAVAWGENIGEEWYCAEEFDNKGIAKDDAAFIAAANPSTILSIITELKQAREKVEELERYTQSYRNIKKAAFRLLMK